MHEIKCPNCGKSFSLDEAGYADILSQVRNDAFDKALNERLELAEREKKTAIELAEAKLKSEMQEKAAKKDAEIERLKAKIESDAERIQAAVKGDMKEEVAKKEAEIVRLNEQLKTADIAGKLALKEALGTVEKERDDLKRDLETKEMERALSEKSLREKYETQIRDRDDAIERLKDMKAKLSTKMVGETLEQHCEIEFSKIRSAAFPTAFFEKDNDAKTGSKGDFIFREADENGTEFISIMFEMKNENDGTATKKKNEDFLRELDKDRSEKGCEYAILVSLLEPDSELYNSGIVDVSHRYPKMYVIRPQFFIPMITLLRNAAQNLHEAAREKPRITIRTRREDPWAVIEVEDNGTGIPAAIRQKIFEPFFTTKEVGKGTGLGLSVSYHIVVQRHRGEMRVESEEGAWSRFIIRLPIEEEAAGSLGAAASA